MQEEEETGFMRGYYDIILITLTLLFYEVTQNISCAAGVTLLAFTHWSFTEVLNIFWQSGPALVTQSVSR